MPSLSEQLDLLEQQGAFTTQQPQQPPPQQPPTEGPPSLSAALDEAEAESAAQRQWEKEQDEGSVVEKYGGQVMRGMFRGGENLMTGAADLLGFDEFADNYESKAGRSSGSFLEKASEFATPIPAVGRLPGALAKLGGRAAPKLGQAISSRAGHVGSAAASGATQAGVYGTVLSDADTAIEKVKDGARAAVTGAGLSGSLSALSKGVVTASEAGKKLTRTIAAQRGDRRVSGDLTFGKKIGDSPDVLSKLGTKAARQLNKGGLAGNTRARDQLTHDDIYLGKLEETFEGVPGAWKAAEKVFYETRSPKKAFDSGNAIANKYYNTSRPNMAAKADQARVSAAGVKEANALEKTLRRKALALEVTNQNKRVQLRESKKANLKRMKDRGVSGEKLKAYADMRNDTYRDKSAQWKGDLADMRADNRIEVANLKKSHAAQLSKMRDEAPRLRPVELDGRRELHKRVVNTKTRTPNAVSGRYSSDSARKAGDSELADLMSPTKTMGFTPGRETGASIDTGKAIMRSGTEIATVVAAIASGRPDLAAAMVVADLGVRAARGVANKGSKIHKSRMSKRPFEPNLDRAKQVPLPTDGTAKKILLGDHAAQQKYRELVRKGDMEGLEKYLTQLFARAEVDDAP